LLLPAMIAPAIGLLLGLAERTSTAPAEDRFKKAGKTSASLAASAPKHIVNIKALLVALLSAKTTALSLLAGIVRPVEILSISAGPLIFLPVFAYFIVKVTLFGVT